MAGKVAPKPVRRPGGVGRIVARDGSFLAIIDLESGGDSLTRWVHVESETAARAQLPRLIDECAREEASEQQRRADVQARSAERARRIELLIERARAVAGAALNEDRGLLLWFLLKHPADDWLPPFDWPRPSGDEIDAEAREGLAVWRGIVLDRHLRHWRPHATEAELTEEVMLARPWQRRDGNPGSTFTAAAWVFLLLLEEAGAPRETKCLALVRDLAEHATIWDPVRRARGAGESAKLMRNRLRLGSPRASDLRLARARLAHARRMFEWFAEGIAERECNLAKLPPEK